MSCLGRRCCAVAFACLLALLLLPEAALSHGRRSARQGSSSTQQHHRSLVDSGQGVCTRQSHAEPIPGYTWLSDEATRLRAQVHQGSQARLRVALDRYVKGSNITIAFLGGSITAGQGAVDGHPFPTWAEMALQTVMGPRVRVHNGAVPGTLSSYMSVCHNIHVPKDVDIVVLDYSINDDYNALPVMDNSVRRPFERLIRKLLNYPKRPAVMLIHSFMWHRSAQMGPSGMYYPSSERDFHEFGTYYGLPELSVKAGAWRLMHKGDVEGFQVHRTRGDHSGFFQADMDAQLQGKVFYWDVIHPDGLTGHKFMGEIVVQSLLDSYATLKVRPLTAADKAEAEEQLLPPMLQNNFESKSDKCFIGPAFQTTVLSSEKWEYKDEGKDKAKPKLGYVSTTPGAVLKLRVNTSSPTGNTEQPVVVELTYLKSYRHMGQAKVSCVEGCLCEGTLIEGFHIEHTSQLYLHEFPVTQHDACIIAVEVLEGSTSGPGHHKVKIAGVVISEEGGDGGVKNWGAVQMVSEGSNKDDQGTFEIRQWAFKVPT